MRLQLPCQIVFLDGDHTTKERSVESRYCPANRKHWFQGEEYDNVPFKYACTFVAVHC